jgi:hypothetical protein
LIPTKVSQGLLAAFTLLVTTEAVAELPQATCPEGWNGPVPVNLGSSEFDVDIHNAGYGLNQRFPWYVHTNANVTWMNPHLLNWDTQEGSDWFSMNGVPITGNLGTQWFGTSFGKPLIVEWRSDGSDNRPGFPIIDQVQVSCPPLAQQVTTAPIEPISLNTRVDILFPFANDVAYFSVTQPSGSPLAISVDTPSIPGVSADFDILASATVERPDYSSSTWAALRGGGLAGLGSEFLVIPAPAGARTIYFGVHNYAGVGHVAMRASRIDFGRGLTICTQEDFTPQQLFDHPGWPNMKSGLRQAFLRIMQATNGNMWKDGIVIKQSSSLIPKDPGNAFCEKDPACDWCMTSFGHQNDPSPWDGCGYQADGAGHVRIPNVRCQGAETDPFHSGAGWDRPDVVGYYLAHEAGHGLARMRQVSSSLLLPDEYADGPQCGHSLMNGPSGSTRFCTPFDHCLAGDPAAEPTCTPKSAWSAIQDSGLFPDWVYPNFSYSAQPWLWMLNNQTAMEAINFFGI